MADAQPTLVELAANITQLAGSFTRYLEEHKIPQPTFAVDSPTSYKNLGPDAFILRQTLIDALQDMWILTQGPSESVFNYVHSVRTLTSLPPTTYMRNDRLTDAGHPRRRGPQHPKPLRLLGRRPARRLSDVPGDRSTRPAPVRSRPARHPARRDAAPLRRDGAGPPSVADRAYESLRRARALKGPAGARRDDLG